MQLEVTELHTSEFNKGQCDIDVILIAHRCTVQCMGREHRLSQKQNAFHYVFLLCVVAYKYAIAPLNRKSTIFQLSSPLSSLYSL
jgi:hypothetical protein